MSNEDQWQNGSNPNDYDIAHLLEYGGPSLRQQEPIEDGVSILDYRNTDENERNISVLLSSQGIPFRIERPQLGWTGTRVRMVVTFPRSQYQQATAVLTAAARASAVDIVEGTEGLPQTPERRPASVRVPDAGTTAQGDRLPVQPRSAQP
jgi:hypothetical protein